MTGNGVRAAGVSAEYRWRSMLARAALAAAALAIVPGAVAQTVAPVGTQMVAPVGTQMMAPAGAAATIRFDIPAQDLNSALLRFASSAGLQMFYDVEMVRDRRSAPVQGSYTPAEALAQLLRGTGIRYRLSGTGTVTLEPPQGAAVSPAVAGAVALPPVQVQAADTQSPTGPGVGYVAKRTLTGAKTDTPLNEIPQSISVVTEQQIKDQEPQNVRQALRYTPGILSEYRGAGGTRYDTIIYRGMGGGVNYDYSYLDGMRLLGANYLIPQIDIYDLSRIEVLRGPASVLYGQGTPGGLVNLVSKMPTEERFGEIQFQAGNRGYLRGNFDFGGPANEQGTVLYRLTGSAFRSDSQVDQQKSERVSIAPAMTWKPDGDTTLTVLGKVQYDPYGGYFGFLPAVGTVSALPTGQRISHNFFDGSPNFDKFQRTEVSLGYDLQHRFDDVWSAESKFRYMHADLDYQSVYTTGINVANPANPLLTRGALWNRSHFDAITTDNNAVAKFTTGPLAHKVLVGVDYQWLGYNEMQGQGTAPALSIFNPNYNAAITIPLVTTQARQRLDQVGLYAQDQIKFGNFSILSGIREDFASNTRRNKLAGTTVDQNDSAFTWRLGGVYEFANGISPYVSYATSFQPVADADAAGNLFKPTTGKQYEVGIKYQPPGRTSFVTAAAYQLTQQNVLTTDPSNTNYSIQTGEVRSRGIELEGQARLTDSLDVLASYTYLDAVNTRSTTAQGYHPTYVPSQSAALWMNYSIRSGAVPGLSFGGGVRYVGSSYANALNTISVPGFTLFDAAVRYDVGETISRLRGLNLAVNATNLFDKTYVSACATATKCFYGLGRTVIGTASFRW